jgi:hypothetical protein
MFKISFTIAENKVFNQEPKALCAGNR